MKDMYEDKRIFVEKKLAAVLTDTGMVAEVKYSANSDWETVTITLLNGEKIYVNVTYDSLWAIYEDVARRLLEVDI